MEARKHLAHNIVRLRKAKNISQEAFAAQCHVSTRYLSTIETGQANPSLQVMERISGALGVTLEQLVHFSDSK